MGALNNAMVDLAFKAVLPILVGIITPHVVDALKKASAWLDAAPAYVKQAAAVVVAGIATMLSTVAGVGVPADLEQWDAALVKTVVAALLGIAIKQHKQLRKTKSN